MARSLLETDNFIIHFDQIVHVFIVRYHFLIGRPIALISVRPKVPRRLLEHDSIYVTLALEINTVGDKLYWLYRVCEITVIS